MPRPHVLVDQPNEDIPATHIAWPEWGGLAAPLLIGALAGLYPAVRAAGLSPTEALRSI